MIQICMCACVCEDVYLLSVSVVFVQGCSQLFSWKLVSELQPSSQQRNILIMWDVNFITGSVKIMSDTKMILAVTNVFSHASSCHQQTHITSSKYRSLFFCSTYITGRYFLSCCCLLIAHWSFSRFKFFCDQFTANQASHTSCLRLTCC